MEAEILEWKQKSNKCIHTQKNVFYQNNHFRFPSKFNAHLYS